MLLVKHWKGVEPVKIETEEAKAIKYSLISAKDGAPNFAMRLFILPKDGKTPFHSHDWEHEIYIIKGKVKLKGKDKTWELGEGHAIYVPPNELHGMENIGDEEARILCMVPLKGDK